MITLQRKKINNMWVAKRRSVGVILLFSLTLLILNILLSYLLDNIIFKFYNWVTNFSLNAQIAAVIPYSLIVFGFLYFLVDKLPKYSTDRVTWYIALVIAICNIGWNFWWLWQRPHYYDPLIISELLIISAFVVVAHVSLLPQTKTQTKTAKNEDILQNEHIYYN